MACKKCGSNKSTSCGCNDTSYHVPVDCTYGGQTCHTPAEPCESVTCTECVRHCHKEDRWCVNMQVVDTGNPDISSDNNGAITVEICMNHGERLDQFLQKIALAHADASAYPFTVKNFYANNVTSTSVELIYFDFLTDLTSMNLFYQAEGSNVWEEIPQFNTLGNPMLTNIFTVTSSMIPFTPGTTYLFKITTTYISTDLDMEIINTVDPASAILYITIPE